MKQDVHLSFAVKNEDGSITVGPLSLIKPPENVKFSDDGSLHLTPVDIKEDGTLLHNTAYPVTLIISPYAYVAPDQYWDEMVAARATEPKLTRAWNSSILTAAKSAIEQAIARNENSNEDIDAATRSAINSIQLAAEVKKAAIVLNSNDVP